MVGACRKMCMFGSKQPTTSKCKRPSRRKSCSSRKKMRSCSCPKKSRKNSCKRKKKQFNTCCRDKCGKFKRCRACDKKWKLRKPKKRCKSKEK